jgi:hypothetical protein
MKIVRDYLTSAEIGYIVNAILEKNTAIEREIVKVALVAQLVCDEIGDFEDCNDIYDKVVADSKLNFSVVINNYNIIDKLVLEETGINKILKDFVEDITNKLDKSIKNLDLNSAISQLKEISEKEATTSVRGGKNGRSTKKSIS